MIRNPLKHPDPKIQRYLHFLVIVCVFGLLFLFAIEFSLELDPKQKMILQVLNMIILLVFLIELLYNLYYAKKKGEYLKTHWWEVIAILPIIEVFRVAKLAELSRISTLLRFGEGVEVIELAEVFQLEENEEKRKEGVLDRIYGRLRHFWHEILAFGHRDIVAIPHHKSRRRRRKAK
jgi:hypothetical protein